MSIRMRKVTNHKLMTSQCRHNVKTLWYVPFWSNLTARYSAEVHILSRII